MQSVEDDQGKEEAIELAAVPMESATDTNSIMKVRVPSIQFLGKEGWMEKLSVSGESSSAPEASQLKPNQAITLDGSQLNPMYGRLPFSDREMEALLMGGASEAELL